MFKLRAKGFTLIELLVVIAIIGVLSTLAIVALSNARLKSRDAKRLADLKQIATALDLYYSDHTSYPTTMTAGQPLRSVDGSTTYLSSVPANPTPRNDGSCPDLDYRYYYNSALSSYYLIGCLGVSSGGTNSENRVHTSVGVSNMGDPSSLLAYWSLDEKSGSITYDIGPNQITGTIAANTSLGQAGRLDSSYSFSSNGYINFGVKTALDISTGDFSVELWAKPESVTGTQYLFDRGTGGYVDGYGIYLSGSLVKFQTDGDGGSGAKVDLTSTSTLTIGQWYHIAAVRRSGVKYLYINGVQEPTTQANTTELSDLTTTTYIAQAAVDTGFYFTGNIDDVRVYGRALTAAEIEATYNQGR